MKKLLVAVALLVAVPLSAADYEKILLPIKPSVVMCGYDSRYETQLVKYNGNSRTVDGVAPDTSAVVLGQIDHVPLPEFVYIPRSEAANMQLSLLVESSDRTKPEMRSFTELPIVRESEFRAGKLQFPGVRIDEGFRQTLRIYGLDGNKAVDVRVRVFPMGSDHPLDYQKMVYTLYPYNQSYNNEGLEMVPTFNMECDLSKYYAPGQQVRVVVEPLTPGAKIWAFLSVTSNATQHFYTVLPR
ncbi:MAG TPA: hypothetical protein VF618_13285 [Thermoanaerobaculia bacterium]